MHPCGKGSQWHLWAALAGVWPAGQGRCFPSPLLSITQPTQGVVLSFKLSSGRQQHTGVHPAKSPGLLEGHDALGEAGRNVLVQTEDREILSPIRML